MLWLCRMILYQTLPRVQTQQQQQQWWRVWWVCHRKGTTAFYHTSSRQLTRQVEEVICVIFGGKMEPVWWNSLWSSEAFLLKMISQSLNSSTRVVGIQWNSPNLVADDTRRFFINKRVVIWNSLPQCNIIQIQYGISYWRALHHEWMRDATWRWLGRRRVTAWMTDTRLIDWLLYGTSAQ